MEGFDVFQDIALRTGGDIYVGVVGPVRTGKSTFIKRFMEVLILPNLPDSYERQRTIDELPQSGAGRTVMTTEPKFVPDQAVAITVGEAMQVRVRLVDSVGFPVAGALGYVEESGPRMVVTPWFDYEIPFEEAAEIGTRKVIADHSTIGVVVTADGSFGEIPRASFAEAERKAIAQIRDLGKPFIVLLNSARPDSADARELAESLEGEYGVRVLPVSVPLLDQAGFHRVLEEILFEFPARDVHVAIPDWIHELDVHHWLRRRMEEEAAAAAASIHKLRDVPAARDQLAAQDVVAKAEVVRIDAGTGSVELRCDVHDELYHQALEEITGVNVAERANLVRLLRELVEAKTQFDRVGEALREAREVGYGVVAPDLADMTFEEPEMVRKGNQFGVRLRAKAPSYHFIRADIEAEYTPILGTERQSEDLVRYLMEKFEDDPQKIWESQIFGRSLHELLREGIRSKLTHMPESAQEKLQETVQRIVNEGSGGLICILF